MKIQNFKDLNSWQQANSLALLVYATLKNFPKEERFSLADQIRRSATSVPSNIAEGFSRKSPKEKINYYYIALGSLSELESQIDFALNSNYLNRETQKTIEAEIITVRKLIFGMIRHLKNIV